MATKFNLVDYTPQVLKIAEEDGKIDVEVALQRFIENLICMKEHHKGCPELNYHELGQQWNKLLSREKVAQKKEALARLQKYSRAGGRS